MHLPNYILITIYIFIFLGSVHGHFLKNNVIDSHLLTQKIKADRTVIVDANGNGDFKRVQDAINHVPNGNSKWIIIHITKGVYREKVSVPRTKPYIFMRGDGRGKTSIVWSKNSANDVESATFKVEATNFVAFGISFKNEAPTSIVKTTKNKSVAAMVGGDKAAFYNCAFFSNHNTLFDFKGRHYYGNCYIQGSVDFIFGHGQSMFDDCEVFAISNWKHEIRGSIAASHRQGHDESSGLVFVKGKVYGVGDVYLGRAKGTHSRVLFANTYLSTSVISHGWTNWSFPGTTKNLELAEYKCHGPGSASNKRVHWSKQLSDEEAVHLASIHFIKGREWLPAWL
ncbi:hypothetical protein ACS0TY_027743 [Phlomoides rotata]